MKIIGLTGGIGSGKTTVLNFFKEFSIPVYISDIEAKKIMHDSIEVVSKITALFGSDAYINGVLNRSYIASLVFNDKEKLKLLNGIVHPAVQKDFLEFVKSQNAPYLIYESALLFENKSEDQFDKVVLVTAPISMRIQRVQKRDNASVSDIEARMNNQLSDEIKIERAHYVVSNIDLVKTKQEVHRLHELFSK
jgi:dephospho-CoA kinase